MIEFTSDFQIKVIISSGFFFNSLLVDGFMPLL